MPSKASWTVTTWAVGHETSICLSIDGAEHLSGLLRRPVDVSVDLLSVRKC